MEYTEMKWRRNGETVRVYNISTFCRTYQYSYKHDIVTYATIFVPSGKRCGGSGWQTVQMHELTPLDFYDKENIYEKYNAHDACDLD